MPTSGFSSLLGFIAVIVMIPVALWLLKRSPMGGGAAQGHLRSIAAMPLSASQRIVTVEVGQGDQRRWLVLGVTPGSITTLHTLVPGPEAAVVPSAPALPFAQLLGKLRRDDGAANGVAP